MSGAIHPLPQYAKVKNEWNFATPPPIRLNGVVFRLGFLTNEKTNYDQENGFMLLSFFEATKFDEIFSDYQPRHQRFEGHLGHHLQGSDVKPEKISSEENGWFSGLIKLIRLNFWYKNPNVQHL
jgi:hypothetical protein